MKFLNKLFGRNLFESKYEIASTNLESKYDKSMCVPRLSNSTVRDSTSNQFDYKSEGDHYKDNDQKIYYISDLHLDQYFPEGTPMEVIENFIESKVDEIVRSGSQYISLFILGDVSSHFVNNKIFYSYLASRWKKDIFVVLGNHELGGNSNPDIAIEKYRQLFEDLQINLVQNNIYIKNGLSKNLVCIEEELLRSISIDCLRNYCEGALMIVFGGIGFSQYNDSFNAENNIYFGSIKSREEERKFSSEFEYLYLKVLEAFGDRQVLIVTHMPKTDWSKNEYNSNWLYLNGHTHRNDFIDNEIAHVFADNQIGYRKKQFTLKHIWISGKYDTFQYRTDGIHIITMELYKDFLRGMGIKSNISRNFDTIYLLKREGLHCFIAKKENQKLFLLNGGVINKLPYNKEYYYENMLHYAAAVKKGLSKYNDALNQISYSVRAIGGTGQIHGCIVDIDFFNHIYLDPFNGGLIPYYAESINNRMEYKNISELLFKRVPELHRNYVALKNNYISNLELEGGQEVCIPEEVVAVFSSDTTMYSPSRIIMSFQYLTELNIIRRWDDKVLLGIQPPRVSIENSEQNSEFLT